MMIGKIAILFLLVAGVLKPSMEYAIAKVGNEGLPITSFLVLSILLVVSLVWRWHHGRQTFAGSEQEIIKIVAIKRLSAKHALVVVDFDGQRKLLGCCDAGITSLETRTVSETVGRAPIVVTLEGKRSNATE